MPENHAVVAGVPMIDPVEVVLDFSKPIRIIVSDTPMRPDKAYVEVLGVDRINGGVRWTELFVDENGALVLNTKKHGAVMP